MFQEIVLPMVMVLFSGYIQTSDAFPLMISWKQKGLTYAQPIKDIRSTTTINGLKKLISKQLLGITIPIEAQKLYSEELKSIFWRFPCKKLYITPLLKDNATCKDYGITQDTLINVEYDFITTAALQGCVLNKKHKKEERKSTTSAQPSIFRIPAQQLLTAVPEEEEYALSTDEKKNP